MISSGFSAKENPNSSQVSSRALGFLRATTIPGDHLGSPATALWLLHYQETFLFQEESNGDPQ